MGIDLNAVARRIDGFLEEIDKLIKLPPEQGEDKKSELDIRITRFIRAAFPDGEVKLEEYKASVHSPRPIIAGETEEEQARREYTETLLAMKSHLIALKDEIELRKEISPEEKGRVVKRSAAAKCRVEERLYEPVRDWFANKFRGRESCFEITAHGIPDKLKRVLDDTALHIINVEKKFPDIMGYYLKKSGGVGMFPSTYRKKIVAEIKDKKLKIDDIYQNKKVC